MVKVPEVEFMVGEDAAMLMSPLLSTMGTVLVVADPEAGYPCRVSELRA